MDPMEKISTEKTPGTASPRTVGELISYYYQKFSEVYENEDLRDLAVSTMIEDVLSRQKK